MNLLTSLPEGAVLTQVDNGFRIDVKTDGFSYVSEFRPAHESDEGVGPYSAHIILPLFEKPDTNYLKANSAKIAKSLSQALLLATNVEDTITFSYSNGVLVLNNINVNAKIEFTPVGLCPDFDGEFKTTMLKTAIANLDSEEIGILPMISEDESGKHITTGIKIWTANMTVTLGSIDEEN